MSAMVKVVHLKRTSSTETRQAGTLMLWRGDVFGFGRLAGASLQFVSIF
jgi:hypothetical protein